MGGDNGEYYGRSTTDGYAHTSRGTSEHVEQVMARTKTLDPFMLPKNRTLKCEAQDILTLDVDDTGSMDVEPKIWYDKMPLVAGQIAICKYLNDPMVSIGAVGDIQSDTGPIQVGDYCIMRQLDSWLERLWLERGGGNGYYESYEMMAYYRTYCCELPNARRAFYLLTADESFREVIHQRDLEKHFGVGNHKRMDSREVFNALKDKYKGNVFLLHRTYGHAASEAIIKRQWEETLGEDHVVQLYSDRSIADVILGILAVVGGTRTLNQYLDDMVHKRDKPQSQERIGHVRRSLEKVQPNPYIDDSLQWA